MVNDVRRVFWPEPNPYLQPNFHIFLKINSINAMFKRLWMFGRIVDLFGVLPMWSVQPLVILIF